MTRLHPAVASAAAAIAVPVLALLAAAGLLHAAGVTRWPLELVHHFVPHLAVLATAATAFCLFTGHRRMAVLAMLLAGFFAFEWGLAPLAPARTSLASTPGETEPLTLVTHNVHVLNPDQDGLIRWLASRPADVVALQEVNPRLIERLRRGEDGYPWRMIAEDEYISHGWHSSEAIVLLSRFPIIEEHRFKPWAEGWQVAFARLRLPDGVRPWIVAVHVPSPLHAGNLPMRDRILERLAPAVAALEAPVIVLGDFNATRFTPAFRRFVADADLQTVEFDPATYPARAGPFGLGIDHVLVRGADLTGVHAMPRHGSDHRPLAARVLLPLPDQPEPQAPAG